jgi:hypothetical protein
MTSVLTRQAKVADLLDRRAQWLNVQTLDGRAGAALPSQRIDNLYWLTDGTTCCCPAFKYRNSRARNGRRGIGAACKHIEAFRCQRRATAPQIASNDDLVWARFED